MNAFSPIRADESMLGSVTERAHRHAISIHCPNCDEMEMAARCDLAAMRDAAMVGVSRASDSAAIMLGEVARLAMNAVYAPIPASRLIRIKAALTLTMMAAREVQRVQQDG